MRKRLSNAILGLLIAILGLWSSSLFSAPSLPANFDKQNLDLEDPEIRLMLGMKLRFQSLGLYEFGLIPGISDTLAKKLLTLKNDLKTSSLKEFATKLEAVNGIGPKRRTQFLRLFDPRPPYLPQDAGQQRRHAGFVPLPRNTSEESQQKSYSPK